MDNPLVPAGPRLGALVAAYQQKLESKGESSRRCFARIARELSEFRDRPILSITAEEWESWFARATKGMNTTTRRIWRSYLGAMMKPYPHWLAPGPPRSGPYRAKRPPTRPELLTGEVQPRRARVRLVLELVALGFMPVEIQRITLDQDLSVQPGPAAQGRRSRPIIPLALQQRLRAYATAKGISAGAPVFPISYAAIYEAVKRATRKEGGSGPEVPLGDPEIPGQVSEVPSVVASGPGRC